MGANIYGASIAEQPVRQTYSLTAGHRTTRTYTGRYANIYALYQDYVAQGSSCELTQDGVADIWTLVVDVQGEDPEVSWDVITEAQSVDILMTEMFTGLTPNERQAIKDYFDNYEGQSISGLADKGISTDLAKKAFLLKLRGLDQVTLFLPVLLVNYIVSNNYEILNATTNVDVIHSTNTLISAEEIPSRLWGALMDSYSVTYSESLDGVIVPLVYHYGWLKGPPQISLVGKGKTKIVQEYRFGAHSADVYGDLI